MLNKGELLLTLGYPPPCPFAYLPSHRKETSRKTTFPLETRLTLHGRNIGKDIVENLRRKTCIQCGSRNLNRFFAIEQEAQPPEYSHSMIAMCADCGRGQLERTYCDRADTEEIFDQTEWYLLAKDSMDRLREFIQETKTDGTSPRKFSRCPEPLSPKCVCDVHWQLGEAAKRLEPLSDEEIQELHGVVLAKFFCSGDNIPRFERSH